MIEGVIVKKLNKYEDGRGWLAEVYRHDEVDYFPAMSYISETKPGVVRGPHEHVSQSDFFIFPGPGTFEISLWDNRKESYTYGWHFKFRAGENNPGIVIVPPGVVHGYKCISDKPAFCINMPNKLYKGVNKNDKDIDEIRWEEMEDSPFKIN
jgi:dTDP-4-dehydrorhamnose 3,5-epimerase